jgi:membrane-associated phospholipid phosphatase
VAVAPWHRLRLAEWLLLGYLAITGAVALARLPGFPPMVWVLLANTLYAVLIVLAARPDLGRAGEVLRDIYPILLLSALYPALDILNYFGGVSTHDLAVRGWELRLFDEELSRTWWQRYPSVFWSTLLHAAYFAYYPIIIAPLAVFLARGDIVAARRTALWLVSTFLLSYLVFLAFPVAGPYYEFPRPDSAFLDNWAARLVYATLERGSAYGAAFPSSHVAATLVATAAAFRGSRLLGALLVGPALLLTIGVVYCQMHYAVDALAGIALAVAVMGAGIWLERGQRGATLFTG